MPFGIHRTVYNSLDPSEECYVLDVRLDASSTLCAVAASNHLVKLYAYPDSSFLGQLAHHRARIHECCFAPQIHPSCLLSASADGTCALWDVRSMRAERIMKNKGGPTRDFFCVDASSMQTVAVGTEYSVLLFDAGSGKLIHTLSDVHTEDVTQVHFHPTAPQILLSASVDGCINAFDVQAAMRSGGQSSQSQSQGAEGAEGEGDEVEDDGIQWTWNAQDSVSKIGITGSQAQWCYVTTHTEGLQVYHLPSQERVIDYGQRVREALGCDYIVDVLGCAPGDDQEQSLLVAAGKFTGEVVVAQCGLVDGQVRPLEQLHGGHSAVVRACVWDKVHNRLITGGEDSRLTVWSQQSASSVHDPTTGASSSSSAKSERDREKSRYSPY